MAGNRNAAHMRSQSNSNVPSSSNGSVLPSLPSLMAAFGRLVGPAASLSSSSSSSSSSGSTPPSSFATAAARRRATSSPTFATGTRLPPTPPDDDGDDDGDYHNFNNGRNGRNGQYDFNADFDADHRKWHGFAMPVPPRPNRISKRFSRTPSDWSQQLLQLQLQQQQQQDTGIALADKPLSSLRNDYGREQDSELTHQDATPADAHDDPEAQRHRSQPILTMLDMSEVVDDNRRVVGATGSDTDFDGDQEDAFIHEDGGEYDLMSLAADGQLTDIGRYAESENDDDDFDGAGDDQAAYPGRNR
eukprot:jgi/Hompol1/3196/HPOL_006401-RA